MMMMIIIIVVIIIIRKPLHVAETVITEQLQHCTP